MKKYILGPMILYFGWFLSTLLIFLIFRGAPTMEIELRDINRILNGSIYVLLFVMTLVIDWRLIKGYRDNKNENTLILFWFFIFSGISGLIQGIFGIIQFTIEGFQDFWTSGTFIFICGMMYFITLFIIQIFKSGIEEKKNKIHLIVVFSVFILLMISNSRKMVLEDISSLELFLPMVILLIITFWEFSILIINSNRLIKQVTTYKEKIPFKWFARSGYIIMISYIGVLVYTATELMPIRYFNTISLAISYIAIYMGFSSLMKK